MARPPDDLERFRPYLRMLVRARLGPRYKGRIDESDVVQDTMKEAFCAQGELAAWTEVQRLAWLKRILANNLIDAIRKDGGRGVPMAEDRDGSSARPGEQLVAGGPSPSEIASRNEQWRRIAELLPELPADWRTALELRYLEGLSLDEVAARMERSKGAVAKLLERGIGRIQEKVKAPEGDPT